MLFRIDYERFLTHAIDHFTQEELLGFKYVIVSTITNQGRLSSVVKLNGVYPSSEITLEYNQTGDKDVLRKLYFDYLDYDKYTLFNAFVNTVLLHHNIMIICREEENVYIDLLVEYLKKNFKMDCVDLNKLFIEGRVGSVYIDRKEIRNKTVEIKRMAATEQAEALASTRDGRMELVTKHMSTTNKIKLLKKLGIHVTKKNIKDIDNLLIEAWVEDN